MYIKRSLLIEKYPNILNIKHQYFKIIPSMSDGYYLISFSPVIDRIIKIYKILKKEDYLIDFYYFCIDNSINLEDLMTENLSNELADSINRQIIRDLRDLGK